MKNSGGGEPAVDVRDALRKIINTGVYKQNEIARRANMQPNSLSAVLNKRRKLEANEMIDLCSALGIRPEELRMIPSGETA